MDDFMFGSKNLKSLGEPNRKIVIEEEPHAAFASDSSNSTASRTSSGWTLYHLATISWEEFAFTLRASVAAGTPDFVTVGCPKFRLGSITICRPLPSGYQMISLPENSSSFKKC